MTWSIADYSLTPSANVAINGINIDEGCQADKYNNALRQFMADMAAFYLAYAPPSFPTTIANGGTGEDTPEEALAALGGLSSDYRGLPQDVRTTPFTFNLPLRGGHVFYTGTTGSCTVPNDANVNFPIGSVLTLINGGSGVLTIIRGLDVPMTGTPITMRWAKDNTTADRALAVGGVAQIIKAAPNLWHITGEGLS